MTQDAASRAACTCTRCGDCDGSGSVWISFSGEYLGSGRCDDMDTRESCETCEGSGVIQECDYCMDMRELDEALKALKAVEGV